MEKALKQLFDFQRFEDNDSLAALIADTHARYEKRELTLDEMDFISAAGMPEKPDKKTRR